MPAAAATRDCEVLVIGAGPAGSACAQMLARAGLDVLLCDRHVFPRDKVCGDGLIPDAHQALACLGLADAVLARAACATRVECFAPRGGQVAVPAQLAVLPRRELDEMLRQAALAAGARWLAPLRFEALLHDADGRVAGARFREGESTRELRARWTVLATGADARALELAGVCERRAPSGMALRGYVRHPGMGAAIGGLQVVWHRALQGGYGWIFPAGGGRFNLGVGYLHRQGAEVPQHAPKLRQLLDAFAQVHEPARELMQGGAPAGEFKGAPLRCSLAGARFARPGLLVTGEAAGSTYLFTGEGIGKAMESGLAAAQVLTHGRRGSDEEVSATYQAALAALQPRFAAYELANRFNEHPWMVDFVTWRARRSPAVLARLAGVLDESQDPGRLASAQGLLRILLPMG
ncbi:NAD(P)/FAD-dependent oxidoreductase [Variovorax sp. OV329]|uniref:NAD(P)/FAD-dependent oxidoreductase n=1 Tax=Variovorax sp. OV329 TaxID=1882825 RepID=UPI0008E785A7|nr:NAD(P)/FAD-dependent oxidoreductase [Variovorax sp. OV329]SFM32502.1 geranylgeranyl reductase family [Variovorax sp. OV329]